MTALVSYHTWLWKKGMTTYQHITERREKKRMRDANLEKLPASKKMQKRRLPSGTASIVNELSYRGGSVHPVKLMASQLLLESCEDGEFEFQSKCLSDLQRMEKQTHGGSFIDQSHKDDLIISMTPPVITFGWQNNQGSDFSPNNENKELVFGSQRMPQLIKELQIKQQYSQKEAQKPNN